MLHECFVPLAPLYISLNTFLLSTSNGTTFRTFQDLFCKLRQQGLFYYQAFITCFSHI